MPNLYKIFNALKDKPLGKWLFSQAVCFKAPYFGSISPRVESIEPGKAVVSLRKTRKVQNHIGTVHAIAACNLAEMAMGMAIEASIPSSMRWLPKAMTVQYIKKSETDLRAIATIELPLAQGAKYELNVPVNVINASGETVVSAVITLWLSPK